MGHHPAGATLRAPPKRGYLCRVASLDRNSSSRVSYSMTPELHQSHLLIIEDDSGQHQRTLIADEYSIGRDRQCDIRLFSQFVSRHHAKLVREQRPDQTVFYRIVDNGSSNGLLINGRKLRERILQNLDEIVFGPQVKATYRFLKQEQFPTTPPDEFDITLIGPNMVGFPEDEPADEVT